MRIVFASDIHDCLPDSCQNGGTCRDGINSYTCDCVTGYTGDNCETGECYDNITIEIISIPGDFDLSWFRHVVEIDVTADTMINLFLPDIDDCMPGICLNGGTCNDGINSYTCECVTGYTGTNCETGEYHNNITIMSLSYSMFLGIYSE